MISRVRFKNFKCLRDVEIELERFTMFVGPNGSGKSSILQGLDLLCAEFLSPNTSAQKLKWGLRRGASDGIELLCEIGEKAYRCRTAPEADRIPADSKSAQRSNAWKGKGLGVGSNVDSTDWKEWKAAGGKPSPLPRSVLLRLEASKLIQSRPGTDATIMDPDGAGLHSALANMALNDPDSWQQLQDDLRQIIPLIRRLRHTKAVRNQPAALLFDTIGADSLSAHQISEGTLFVLGLLAAFYASNRPNLILLDDVDRGLHPKAQQELVALLRKLLDAHPQLQLLAATHSPYMLDSMKAEEVRMTLLGNDAATVCAPLAKHPEFEKWKDEMTPGEMWSLFGEKWLVGEPSCSAAG